MEISLRDAVRLNKIDPANDKVILFIWQDLESIGGMPGYNNKYFDTFPAPGRFTRHNSFKAGLPHTSPRLTEAANWGDGLYNMALTN